MMNLAVSSLCCLTKIATMHFNLLKLCTQYGRSLFFWTQWICCFTCSKWGRYGKGRSTHCTTSHNVVRQSYSVWISLKLNEEVHNVFMLPNCERVMVTICFIFAKYMYECHWVKVEITEAKKRYMSATKYCKTLNVSVPFISRILRAKQNCDIKGREYQLQAKIGRNYYSISNCMVLIRRNKRAKIILHAKSPTFRAAKLKGFTVHIFVGGSPMITRWACCVNWLLWIWVSGFLVTWCNNSTVTSERCTLFF